MFVRAQRVKIKGNLELNVDEDLFGELRGKGGLIIPEVTQRYLDDPFFRFGHVSYGKDHLDKSSDLYRMLKDTLDIFDNQEREGLVPVILSAQVFIPLSKENFELLGESYFEDLEVYNKLKASRHLLEGRIPRMVLNQYIKTVVKSRQVNK